MSDSRVQTLIGYILPGLFGVLVAVVTVTMSYGDTAHTATAAQDTGDRNAIRLDEHGERLREGEQWRAADTAHREAVMAGIAELKEAVKTLAEK